MQTQRNNTIFTAAIVLGALIVSPAFAKKDPPSQNDPRYTASGQQIDPRTGAPIQSNPSQGKVKLSSEDKWLFRVHDVIGCTEDEWQVLKPRVEKVMYLIREAQSGRDPKGPREPKALNTKLPQKVVDTTRPPTPVSDASKALVVSLFDQSAQLSDLRQRVAEARIARAKVRAELARAQEELREILTFRQEAELIIMGILD